MAPAADGLHHFLTGALGVLRPCRGRCVRLLEFRAGLIAEIRHRARNLDRVEIGVAAFCRHAFEAFDGMLDQRVVALLQTRRPRPDVAGFRCAGHTGCMAGCASKLVDRLAGLQRSRAASLGQHHRSDRLEPIGNRLWRHRRRSSAAGLVTHDILHQQDDDQHRDNKRQNDHRNQLSRCLDR